MAIRARSVVVVSLLTLVMGACTSGSLGTPSTEASPTGGLDAATPSAPSQTSRDLQESGWLMVGAPAAPVEDWESSGWQPSTARQMVTDGVGQVWLAGLWQMTRLDPASGKTSTWDAADDAGFAWSDVILAPSAGAGVWILDGTRVRRFDGERFTVDLTVPEEQLGPENIGSARYVHDLVEVGSEVWLSLADSRYSYLGRGGQVLRWADGQWTAMSAPGDGIGGSLAVDAQGSIWAGGWEDSGVRRWDGSTWTVPGAGGPNAPTTAGDVAADPTGGLWFVSCPGDPQSSELRWFDGTIWRTAVGVPGWQPGAGALAVSADGDAWVAWTRHSAVETYPAPDLPPPPSGLRRVTHDGSEETFGLPQGSSRLLGVALAPETVAVLGDDGRVSRLAGQEWRDVGEVPTSEPLRIRDPYGKSAHAVSGREVWVAKSGHWHRNLEGEWSRLGPGTEGAVVASDGALWGWDHDYQAQTVRLVRQTWDGFRVMTTQRLRDIDSTPDHLYADRNGSVWVVDDGDVVEFRADGTRHSIGHPKGMDLIFVRGVGVDGTVWVSGGLDEGGEDVGPINEGWHRWDGRRWAPEQAPDIFVSSWQTAVADDGTGWALGGEEGGTGYAISRYSGGAVRTFVSGPMVSPHTLTVLTGGQACVVEVPVEMEGDTPITDSSRPSGIACYDDDGQYATFALPDLRLQGVAIAPDGAVWVLGPQVVRLTKDLSEAQGSDSPIERASPSAPVGTIQPSATPIVGATALAAGGGHSCAIVGDGRVACWGGINGVVMYGPRAVTVPALTGVTALTAGGAHSCAVVAGGRVTCWGYNYTGLLGDGTTENRVTPVTVRGVAGAVDVAAGSTHTCALVSGGGVQCWGWNEFGQLGDGTTTNRTSPVAVRGLTGARALSSGQYHTCALVSGGGVQCWGSNEYGQLGDGTTTNRPSPVPVTGVSGAAAVAAGGYQTCAILLDGGVQCWGMDESVDSADGEVINRVTPVTVEGVTGATSVGVGGRHACAVVEEGRVRCWGLSNIEGQLGDGTTDHPSSPVTVEGLAGATAVAAGDMHTCAILSSGGVECWGWNSEGQLGDGSEQGRLAPVTVTQ